MFALVSKRRDLVSERDTLRKAFKEKDVVFEKSIDELNMKILEKEDKSLENEKWPYQLYKHQYFGRYSHHHGRYEDEWLRIRNQYCSVKMMLKPGRLTKLVTAVKKFVNCFEVDKRTCLEQWRGDGSGPKCWYCIENPMDQRMIREIILRKKTSDTPIDPRVVHDCLIDETVLWIQGIEKHEKKRKACDLVTFVKEEKKKVKT